ncbi:MAG: 2-oxoglutarate and iron-dependent oxygenase domain-containing protein, partial [Candidatus Poseidoniaceae archaeon]
MTRSLQVCDLRDWHAGGDARERFVTTMGDALKDIGFFALTGHGISAEAIDQAYATIGRFFHLDDATKRTYERADMFRQRGYTPYGVEHAKDNPEPDLKEFWQTGRPYPEDGTVPTYPQNIWPTAHVSGFQDTTETLFS